MACLHGLTSVLRQLVQRTRAEPDLRDELQAVVKMAAADKKRDGASPAQARRLAAFDLSALIKSRVDVGLDNEASGERTSTWAKMLSVTSTITPRAVR
jgi:hypothetical protein